MLTLTLPGLEISDHFRKAIWQRINSSYHMLVALHLNELVIAVLQEVHPCDVLKPHLHVFIFNSGQHRRVLMWPNVTPDIA